MLSRLRTASDNGGIIRSLKNCLCRIVRTVLLRVKLPQPLKWKIRCLFTKRMSEIRPDTPDWRTSSLSSSPAHLGQISEIDRQILTCRRVQLSWDYSLGIFVRIWAPQSNRSAWQIAKHSTPEWSKHIGLRTERKWRHRSKWPSDQKSRLTLVSWRTRSLRAKQVSIWPKWIDLLGPK